MAKHVSTVAAIEHLSLAVAFGGPLFAKIALPNAVKGLSSDKERGQVMEKAWDRFTPVNLAAHVAFTGAWAIGRSVLRSYRLDARTERLIRIKDFMVRGALITGVANAVVGKLMKAEIPGGVSVSETGTLTGKEAAKAEKFRGYFRVMGPLNLAFITGIIVVSPILGMSAVRHFLRRPYLSRLLAH